MGVLWVSGDSWTSCWPLEERLGHRKFGWPNLVSESFKCTLIDTSRAGSSNDRIYRKAFEGLISNANVVIVALTSYLRIETGGNYGEKPGCIYQHIVSDYASEPAWKLFFNGYLNYSNMLRQIISLQTLAKQKNVHCYFLDTFAHNLDFNLDIDNFKIIVQSNPLVFDHMDDERIQKKFYKIKTLERSIDQSTFINKKSYQSLVKGCNMEQGHPVQEGHRKIADIIIKFLKDKHGQTI